VSDAAWDCLHLDLYIANKYRETMPPNWKAEWTCSKCEVRLIPAPAPAEGLREALAQYAGALEAIVRSLPGGPIVNGVPLSTEEAIADLRQRFGVGDAVIDQATLRAGITHDRAALARHESAGDGT
jgi:hypothetical protein